MRRVAAIAALMLCVVFLAGTASTAAPSWIEDMEKQLMSKYRGAGPEMIIKLLGAPDTTSTIKGTDYLVWVVQKSGPTTMTWPDPARSRECKATFAFEGDKLSSIHLAGVEHRDWKLCEDLVDPLLKAPEAPASPNGGDEKEKPCLDLPSPDKEACIKKADEKVKRDLHEARDKYIEDSYKACLVERDGLLAELAVLREELAAARKK